MPTTILNATFDGVSDVNTLNGGTRSFDSRFMGYYSIYEENAANNLVANISLTGNNWTVSSLRIGAASEQTQLNLTDLNGFAGRRIDYLQLGYNSDVNLISTQVRFIIGYDGNLHDISLGSSSVNSINLYASQNNITTGSGYVGNIQIGDGVGNVTVNGNVGAIKTDAQNDSVIVNSNSVTSISTGQGNDRVVAQGDSFVESVVISGGNNTIIARDTARIESLRMSNGDNTIRILDDARIRHINLNEGDNTLITTGYVEGVTTWESSNNVTIGAGGIGSMIFYSDTRQTHVIDATGYVENLRTTDSSSTATDDQTTRLTLGDAGAGSVFLGSGNDRVTTGDGYVDFLHTGRGNDIVNVGSGGMGTLVLHDGDDRVRVQNLDNVNTGLIIQGRDGYA